jgi:hemoglobin
MAGRLIDQIGGEPVLRALVERFYDVIEEHPRGSQIVKLHKRGHGMVHARAEQFNFLSGFMGGRRYYDEKHGHMDVKLMHAHVPVSAEDAENWLLCLDQALGDLGLEGPAVERLRMSLRRVALVLINDLGDWGEAPTGEV